MKPLILLTIIFCLSVVHATEITVLSDPWCPFNCKSTDKDQGFEIDLVRFIFEKAGYTVKYQNLNWTRAINNVRMGKGNAIVGAYKIEAPNFIFPEESFGPTKECFFALKGEAWEYKGFASLKGKRVSIGQDFSYGKEFDEFKVSPEGKKIIEYVGGDDPLTNNLSKIEAKRVDLFISNHNVFQNHLLTEPKWADKVVERGCLPSFDNYIGFSPNNPESKKYATIMSNGLIEARKSGVLKKIMAKYGLKDWK